MGLSQLGQKQIDLKIFLRLTNHLSSCTSIGVALLQNRIKLYTVNYLVFATCLRHDLFIWNPSTSCSKNCSRSERGIERELQDQSQNALLCYRAWYAFATELLSRTCVKTDGLLDVETFLNKFVFVQVDSNQQYIVFWSMKRKFLPINCWLKFQEKSRVRLPFLDQYVN